MSQKKSFMEVICSKNLENEYKSAINIFKELKSKENLEYIPIDYFFIHENFDKDVVYKLFHIMLDYNIIDKVEFVECDSCGSESLYNDLSINFCSRCKEIIYNEHIVENFKLLKEDCDENK